MKNFLEHFLSRKVHLLSLFTDGDIKYDSFRTLCWLFTSSRQRIKKAFRLDFCSFYFKSIGRIDIVLQTNKRETFQGETYTQKQAGVRVCGHKEMAISQRQTESSGVPDFHSSHKDTRLRAKQQTDSYRVRFILREPETEKQKSKFKTGSVCQTRLT